MINYSDNELILTINSLSDKQKEYLAKKLRPSQIKSIFDNIKLNIAQEAKRRIQSKIALNFRSRKGELFNSIYYQIQGDQIILSSTKSYFAILNAGYNAFDMKKALGGRVIPMRLPGGRIIFRSVPQQNSLPSKSGKPSSAWIHPGYRGRHIYEQVEAEMEQWVRTYVREQVDSLLEMAGSSAEYSAISNPNTVYTRSSNRVGYLGQGLLREDLLTMSYRKHNNATVPSNLIR